MRRFSFFCLFALFFGADLDGLLTFIRTSSNSKWEVLLKMSYMIVLVSSLVFLTFSLRCERTTYVRCNQLPMLYRRTTYVQYKRYYTNGSHSRKTKHASCFPLEIFFRKSNKVTAKWCESSTLFFAVFSGMPSVFLGKNGCRWRLNFARCR